MKPYEKRTFTMTTSLRATIWLALCPVVMLAQPALAEDLTVRIDSLKSQKGQVTACIWQTADKFPNCDGGTPFARQTVAASARSITIVFKNVPPGPIAVSAVHDENGNGRVDTNFVGLPLEGVALSNNPKMGFGPPRFKASVTTPKPNTPLIMRLIYP